MAKNKQKPSSKYDGSKRVPIPPLGKGGKPAKKREIKIFGKKFDLNRLMNKSLLYVFIGLLFLPLLVSVIQDTASENISLTEFVDDVRNEKVDRVEVAGNELRIFYKDEAKKITRKENNQQLVQVFDSAGIDLATVNVKVENLSFWAMLWELMTILLPIILIAAVFFFLFRQARGGQDVIMGIGRSKAKLFIKGKQILQPR